MSTKAIKNVVLVLIFATLLIPFIVFNSSYFPFIVGKAFIFRSLIAIALLFWGWLVFKDSKYLPSKNGILISFGLLTLFYLISAFLGQDLWNSVFSNFERMGGWVNSAFLFTFFLISSSVLKEKETWNKFFLIQISSSLILFLIGLGELFSEGLGTRIDATLGNPIYLSVIFLFSIFFALYLIFEKYSKGVKYFLGATIFINILGVFFTGTRGAMLGLFVSGLFLTIYLIVRFWSNNKVKFAGLTFLILAILAPVLLFSFKDSSFVTENNTLYRITQISIQEGTGYARFVNWGIAMNGIKERPVFGWGQENYIYVFDKHYDPRMYGQESFFDSSHNTVLDVAIHGGFLALIAYLSVFVFAIIYLFKNSQIKTEQKVIITALLGAYFIQNLFVFDNLTSSILFISVLAFIASNKKREFGSNLVASIVLSFAIIISIVAFLFTIFFPWKTNTNLFNGIRLNIQRDENTVEFFHPKGIEDNINYFEKALRNSFTDTFQIRTLLSRVAISALRMETEDESIKNNTNKIVNFAIEEYIKEIESHPENARVKYNAGIFFAQIGDFENAERILENAVAISPERQLYLTALSSVKKDLGKQDESLELLKKAYEVEKNIDKAWFAYVSAVGAVDAKRFEELLIEAKDLGQINRLMTILNVGIQKNPDSPQAYVNKIVVLANIGLFDQAIIELDILEERFPELVPQTKNWRALFEKGQIPK